jgi:hypothetical protein
LDNSIHNSNVKGESMSRYLSMVAFIIALAINLIGNNAWAAEDGIENVPQIRFSMLESGFRMNIDNVTADEIALSNIKDYGNGVRVGYKDGKTITVRGHSSYGGATLEIKNGNNIIKIRYD